MEHQTLCDLCVHRYNGCYLYEFFVVPLQAEGVELIVQNCRKFADSLEEEDFEL